MKKILPLFLFLTTASYAAIPGFWSTNIVAFNQEMAEEDFICELTKHIEAVEQKNWQQEGDFIIVEKYKCTEIKNIIDVNTYSCNAFYNITFDYKLFRQSANQGKVVIAASKESFHRQLSK